MIEARQMGHLRIQLALQIDVVSIFTVKDVHLAVLSTPKVGMTSEIDELESRHC